MKRIAFTTLGCKANWTDTESLIQACKRAGLEIVSFEDTADVYVVNTCAVTLASEKQSKQMLRRAKRINPNAVVIATGCLGEINSNDLLKVEGLDHVFGTGDRGELLKHILKVVGYTTEVFGDDSHNVNLEIPTNEQSRARAFLKIQDGCDNSCSYCVVPAARGKSRSVPPEIVLNSAKALSKYHKEIVLTGIDIGQYGRDLGYVTLCDLISRLLGDGDISRIRLSSIKPTSVDSDLIALFENNEKLCRHVHLSIQSMSDRVISMMNRSYLGSDVEKAVLTLSRKVPHIAITGDIIAGFPGETDDEHGRTLGILSALPMAGAHIFPFSPRPATRAFAGDGHLSKETVQRRARELRFAAAGLRKKFIAGLVGKTFDVIVTSREHSGNLVSAFSDNAVSILLPEGRSGYGDMGRAKIENVNNLEVHGSWV